MSPSVVSTVSADVAGVRVPGRSIRHDLRVVRAVFHRELLRFRRDRIRMVAAPSQPLMWLLVIGTGMSGLVAQGHGDPHLKAFIYPGVCGMSLIFPAMQSAASVVWDREFGFLREMLVAPVSSGAIVLGKCLGGALAATAQGTVIVLMAGLAGVPYDPVLLLTLLGEMFLGALAITGFGVMLSARFKSLEAFLALNQMVNMPMVFLSGAFFPLSGLPPWLSILTRFDPLTYVVDPMRQAVFARLDVQSALATKFNAGVTWFGWRVPVGLELTMVAVIAISLVSVAVLRFRQTD